jgi:hypothetical protein
MNSLVSAGQVFSGDVDFPAGPVRLSAADRADLERAMRDLEGKSLAIKLCAVLGRRVTAMATIVPPQLAEAAARTAEAAVRSGLSLALRSLAGKPLRDRRRMHKSIAVLAGAAGGAFGFSTLAVELPLSTTIMLRSIADIARSEGHDLSEPGAALSCLEVFALGGRIGSDPRVEFPDSAGEDSRLAGGVAAETGYFALRAILARSVTDAIRYLGGRGIVSEAAPALVRLIAQMSAHFGVAVSQKLVVQSVPLIGAAGGAAINYIFADHFQTVARGHFTVLRLERRYGAEIVRAEYERMRNRVS